jgi:hypothetical protein
MFDGVFRCASHTPLSIPFAEIVSEQFGSQACRNSASPGPAYPEINPNDQQKLLQLAIGVVLSGMTVTDSLIG